MAAIINGSVFRLTSVQRLSKIAASFNGASKVLSQNFSTEKPTNEKPVRAEEKDIIKSVFISQSNDIFTNLALEDWIYKNTDFDKHHVLLIWRNASCVVVGRHQNPWLEANMEYLAEKGIDIARRNSGGSYL